MAITIVVFTFIQNPDLKFPESVYDKDKDFCEDTILKEHRPFRVFYTSLNPSSNTSNTFHICAGKDNSTTAACVAYTFPANEKHQMYCGWDRGSTLKRAFISGTQVFCIILLAIWLIKDWKLCGFFVS